MDRLMGVICNVIVEYSLPQTCQHCVSILLWNWYTLSGSEHKIQPTHDPTIFRVIMNWVTLSLMHTQPRHDGTWPWLIRSPLLVPISGRYCIIFRVIMNWVTLSLMHTQPRHDGTWPWLIRSPLLVPISGRYCIILLLQIIAVSLNYNNKAADCLSRGNNQY